MPITNKGAEQASTVKSFVGINSSDLFRPFAEKLAVNTRETDPSEAVEVFIGVLNLWIHQIIMPLAYDVGEALSAVQESAISLQRELTSFKSSAHLNPVPHEHAVLTTGTGFLNGYLRDVEPPFADIDSLCGLLSKLIEGIRGYHPRLTARRRGKPSGIKKYPGLIFLVFRLGICAETHLVAPFTAHIKKTEDLKIAAGSLIETLDSLRDYLLGQDHWQWLATQLPTRAEHPTYVPSYQRALRCAWEQVHLHSGQTPAATPQA